MKLFFTILFIFIFSISLIADEQNATASINSVQIASSFNNFSQVLNLV